jgi:hypothetical protein
VDWAGLLQALSLLDADTEKVVGFRRREAVRGFDRPQRSTSVAQEPRLPISQSCGFPISQSCELPISQSKDSLLAGLRQK